MLSFNKIQIVPELRGHHGLASHQKCALGSCHDLHVNVARTLISKLELTTIRSLPGTALKQIEMQSREAVRLLT